MPEEPTLTEETQAAEAAKETTQSIPSDEGWQQRVQRAEEAVLREQRVNSKKDREIQELRSKMVTRDDLKERDDKMFSVMELMLPEEEDAAPVSRRERLRQLRETKPAAPTPQESPEVQYFNRRLKEEGYELSDSVVKEVVSNLSEDDTPDVAIKRIKSEKEKRAKSDDDRIQQAIDAGVMAKLKELGVLKGDGQPSAAVTDRAELRRLYVQNPHNPRAAEWEAIRNQRQ